MNVFEELAQIQIELQKAGQYHIHYKNLRIELGKKRLEEMARTMYDSIEK